MELPPLSIELIDIQTFMIFLKNCSDTGLVLEGLGKLECLIETEEENIISLVNPLFLNLLEVLEKQRGLALITKFILKVLCHLVKLSFDTIEPSNIQILIETLIHTEFEYNTLYMGTYLLAKFSTFHCCCLQLCRPELLHILTRILQVLTGEKLFANTLMILLNLIKTDQGSKYIIDNLQARPRDKNLFNINLLMDIVKKPKSNVTEILARDILFNLSKNNNARMHIMLARYNLLRFAVHYLKAPVWNNELNTMYGILLNCAKRMPVKIQVDGIPLIIEFIKNATQMEASDEHKLAGVAMIEACANIEYGRQLLQDYDVLNMLKPLFRSPCLLTQLKICDALSQQCLNQNTLYELFASEDIFIFVRKLFYNTYYPMSPYRQNPWLFLHKCITTQPALKRTYFTNFILRDIHFFFEAIDKMDKGYYCKMLEILKILTTYRPAVKFIIAPGFYKSIFVGLKSEHEPVAMILFDILKDTIQYSVCRLFLIQERTILSNIFQLAKNNDKLLYCLLPFLEKSCNYPDITDEYCSIGFIHLLELKSSKSNAVMDVCASTSQMVFDRNLSLKFFLKNKLDVNDRINSGFFTYLQERPTGTVVSEEDLLNSYVIMLFVDFTIHSEDILSTSRISRSSTGYSIDRISKKSTESTGYSYTSSKISVTSKRFSKFFAVLENKVNNVTNCMERVRIIAESVCMEFSGHEDFTRLPAYSEYLDLLDEIPFNNIPLSQVRVGYNLERAILFKITADALNIPCILCRNSRTEWVWTEIQVIQDKTPLCASYVVDLTHQVAELYESNSRQAHCYIEEEIMI